MNFFLLFFILFLVAGGAVWFWFDRKYREMERELRRMQKEMKKERELFGGFEEYNKKRIQLIVERKQKIMEALHKEGKITARKAADLIEVSRATICRYFDDLEHEGKVRQTEKFGRKVAYKIR